MLLLFSFTIVVRFIVQTHVIWMRIMALSSSKTNRNDREKFPIERPAGPLGAAGGAAQTGPYDA
jgi:hypothetical protein